MISFLASLLFAAVTCEPMGDGSWRCSGEGDVIGGGNFPGIVVTNGMGICTNCVAMSKSDCEILRNDLLYRVGIGRDLCSYVSFQLEQVCDDLISVMREGDGFNIYNFGLTSTTSGQNPPDDFPRLEGETASDWRMRWVKSLPTYAYYYGRNGTSTSWDGMTSSNNGIANYYQEGVKPVLQRASEIIGDQMRYLNSDVNGTFNDLDRYINGIACDECSLTLGEGEGGGGGSGGGGSSGGTCGPCVEQLKAMKTVVDDISSEVKKISVNTSNVFDQVKKFREDVNKGLNNITNTLNRIDDYVRDDLDSNIKAIVNSCIVISNNIDSVYREFFEDYNRANEFSDKFSEYRGIELHKYMTEPDTPLKLGSGYENSPWFLRIEYLLQVAAGYGGSSITNALAASEQQSQAESKIQEVEDDAEGQKEELVSSHSAATASVKSVYDALQDLFSSFTFFGNGSADLSFSIATFTPDKTAPDLQTISISPFHAIDDTSAIDGFIKVCRAGSQFVQLFVFIYIYWVTFRYLTAKIFVVIGWIVKIYLSAFGSK